MHYSSFSLTHFAPIFSFSSIFSSKLEQIQQNIKGKLNERILQNELKDYWSYKTFGILRDCVKNVSIWSFSGPHFPAFGLNTER